MTTLDNATPREFERIAENFIAQLADWDGSLPIDAFLNAWTEIDRARQAPEIQARIIDDHLVLVAPPNSPVIVQGNRLRWEDGHEVVIRLAT